MAAAALSALLPGVLEGASNNPLSLNNLMNLGAYEIYGKQMENDRFSNQLKMQNQQFGQQQQMNTTNQNFISGRDTSQFQNSVSLNGTNFANQQTLQQNQFAHNFNLQQLNASSARELNSQNIKGNLVNTAAQGGIGMMGKGFDLLGNYLNYSYNAKLQNQAFENNSKMFNMQTDKAMNAFQSEGMPGWAAFASPGMMASMPHASQVQSGINTRTAALPGRQTQFYSQTSSQTALGLGVVNVE